MDLERAIGQLHVVRHYRPEPLDDADLRAILDAGRRTGSSKNLQRWHFIVVRDRDRLAALAGVGDTAAHLAGAAVAVALITPDPHAPDQPLSVTWDLGRAAQDMILVAWARGIGSCPATVYDHALCRRMLGYPSDRHCEYLLGFGYPASSATLTRPLQAGGRRKLSEVVFYERWGATAAPAKPPGVVVP